jgi:hypothetical protein
MGLFSGPTVKIEGRIQGFWQGKNFKGVGYGIDADDVIAGKNFRGRLVLVFEDMETAARIQHEELDEKVIEILIK